ncbi:hypothetical protein E2C01_086203 [Portunus trituberculatus]|uniref:Uncharacterized protein n=1 Tax=Portunus trituberculatus TaxID=210409 RepID=A0A5B7JFQ3_PORTR|nr:hypothetical protein [Portunus trituberculatus]
MSHMQVYKTELQHRNNDLTCNRRGRAGGEETSVLSSAMREERYGWLADRQAGCLAWVWLTGWLASVWHEY